MGGGWQILESSTCICTCHFLESLRLLQSQVFTNSAAALPCEIGSDGQPMVAGKPRSGARGWTPARSVDAWRQRLAADRAQKQARRSLSAHLHICWRRPCGRHCGFIRSKTNQVVITLSCGLLKRAGAANEAGVNTVAIQQSEAAHTVVAVGGHFQ